MNDRAGSMAVRMEAVVVPDLGSERGWGGKRPILLTVGFILSMLLALWLCAHAFFAAMVIVPRMMEAPRDFGLYPTSTLARATIDLSAWLLGKSSGQSLPGTFFVVPVVLGLFTATGFIGSRRKGLGIAAALLIVGAAYLATTLMMIGCADMMRELEAALTAGSR